MENGNRIINSREENIPIGHQILAQLNLMNSNLIYINDNVKSLNNCMLGMNNKIDKMNQKIEQLAGEKNENITAHRTKENEIILQENTLNIKTNYEKEKEFNNFYNVKKKCEEVSINLLNNSNKEDSKSFKTETLISNNYSIKNISSEDFVNYKNSSKNSKKSMDNAINSNLQRGNKDYLEDIQNKNDIASLNNIINEDTKITQKDKFRISELTYNCGIQNKNSNIYLKKGIRKKKFIKNVEEKLPKRDSNHSSKKYLEIKLKGNENIKLSGKDEFGEVFSINESIKMNKTVNCLNNDYYKK